jgi:hypothetical protein
MNDNSGTVHVPRVILKYLERCDEQEANCYRIQSIAIGLGVALAILILFVYYYIHSTGGFKTDTLTSIPNKLSFQTSPDTTTTADATAGTNAAVTPVAAPPTYGKGNLTPPGYAGCSQKDICGRPEVFNTDELLDAQIITQKISEYETTYADEFNPGDSAYNHERFMVDDSLGADVVDSHQQWAEEAKSKSVSLSSLVTPFDPDEALTGDGIRHAKPKAPPKFGILDFEG